MKRQFMLPLFSLFTVIVCFSAIFLPERLAVRQDRELLMLSYSEDVSDAGVQLDFDLTTAQKLHILSRASFEPTRSLYVVNGELTPGADEIQLEQCAQVCFDELNLLAGRSQAPSLLNPGYPVEISSQYYGILNWDNPQERLSLWAVQIFFIPEGEKVSSGQETNYITCLMDAETGTLYTITLNGSCFSDLVNYTDLPALFAEYFDMELIPDKTQTIPSISSEFSITRFTLAQDDLTFTFDLAHPEESSANSWLSLELVAP